LTEDGSVSWQQEAEQEEGTDLQSGQDEWTETLTSDAAEYDNSWTTSDYNSSWGNTANNDDNYDNDDY